MEYFTHSKYVRLRSHHDKFLVPTKDGKSVKQTRHTHSRKAHWSVELVRDKPNMIRLRSYNRKYLTTSDEPYLLGWTGKKVLLQPTPGPLAAQWEPITDEFCIKLRAPVNGKYLRGNGGSPPWRNSVTVDVPEISATKNWIMWTVEIVDSDDHGYDDDDQDHCVWPRRPAGGSAYNNGSDSTSASLGGGDLVRSSVSSISSIFSSSEEEDDSLSCYVMDVAAASSLPHSKNQTAMELFQDAKTVRLRSHNDKYLLADDDRETVCQDRHGGSRQARWTVEYVSAEEGVPLVRFKSIYDRYLTATDDEFLLGVTGKKVKQTIPRRLDSSIEWEPIRDGMQVKLKTRYGNFLRANGGLPPWRNSITHDVPSRSHTQDWILWEVDVLEVYDRKPVVEEKKGSKELERLESEVEPFSLKPLHQSSELATMSGKNEGHVVHYNIVDDFGSIVEGEQSLVFKGNGVTELTQKLEQETGLPGLTVCSRNPLNGKLYPMKLALPPNHVKLHVYVVPSTSAAAKEFANN